MSAIGKPFHQRKSYHIFSHFWDFLETRPTHAEILHEVHGVVDRYQGFRSRTQSESARASIQQLVTERGTGVTTYLEACPSCRNPYLALYDRVHEDERTTAVYLRCPSCTQAYVEYWGFIRLDLVPRGDPNDR